jgi:hypothetical protein
MSVTGLLNKDRAQMFLLEGTRAAYDSGIEVAGNAHLEIYNARPTLTSPPKQRMPQSPYLSQIPNIAGGRFGGFTFSIPLRGLGSLATPGIDLLLLSHGMSVTAANAGSFTTAKAWPTNTATSATLAGSYTGTEMRRYIFFVESLVYDTSLSIRWLSLDEGLSGGNSDSGTFTHTKAGGPIAIDDGITVDFTGTYTDYVIGDTWEYFAYKNDIRTYKYNDSAEAKVLDIALLQEKRIFRLHDALVTTISIPKTSVDEEAMLDIEVVGLLPVSNPQADVALKTGIVYDTAIPPAVRGVTCTLHGHTLLCASGFSLEMNRQSNAVRDFADARGYSKTEHGPAIVTGTVDPSSQTIATINWFDKFFQQSVGAFSVSAGSVGNKWTISGDNVQIGEVDAAAEEDNHLKDELSLEFKRPQYSVGGDYSPITILIE